MATHMPASVRFENVSKKFGQDVVAVDNVNFEIKAGSLVTLLGPSGCGKTTTLRMIAGLEFPTSGSIFIGNEDVSKHPASSRSVSMVFQSYALFPHMNVLENVMYGLQVAKVSKEERRHKAIETLKLVGLEGFNDRLPSELSGGQQQRVAIARALVLKPQVLLFDEPLSNLDAKLRRKVRQDIRDLQQALNLTVVYVTHDQEEALAVSDEIIVMNQAVIAQKGSPKDLYQKPNSEFIANFMGESNLIDSHLVAETEHLGTIAWGSTQLKVNHPGLSTGAVKLSIRPETFSVSMEKPSGAFLKGKVVKSSYLGNHIEYTLDTPLGELFVMDYQKKFAASTKEDIYLGLDENSVTVIPRSEQMPSSTSRA